MKVTTKEVKELLLSSLPNCIPNDNKRKMVGTNASIDMIAHKVTKMDMLKEYSHVMRNPNKMQVK